MIENFHFLRPWWLLSLIPAASLWWLLFRRQDVRTAWRALIAPHLLDHLLVGGRQRKRVRPIHLLLLVWVLMGISLAGPSWQKEPSPFAEDTAGMIVVFKVTPSMTAEDVQPSRLERGKQKLHDLLEMREGGATGLIAYSGSAHLVMPLTRDGRIIDIMAEGLEPGIMPVEGDALADALIMAGSHFKQAGRAGSVLVIADTVSPAQVAKFNQPPDQERPPVQFLAVTALGAPADQGLENAANALGARVAKLTIDASDLEAITRQARRDLQTVLTQQSGERWKDSGYALVPLIVLAALPWARRGWQVSN